MSDEEIQSRETFLRAIFDRPDDPVPRMIYADWLEDKADADASIFQNELDMTQDEIQFNDPSYFELMSFRRLSVTKHWIWFHATRIKLSNVQILDASVFDLLNAVPAARNIVSFCANPEFQIDSNPYPSIENAFIGRAFTTPVISNAAVERLAKHRFARKLIHLDLCFNDLGNDAARAIARSPFLDNLKSLRLSQGNRIRGRVWQEVVERFGEEVVE